MDNINWVKLKDQDDGVENSSEKPVVDSLGAASSDEEEERVDEIEMYKKILGLLKPGEYISV